MMSPLTQKVNEGERITGPALHLLIIIFILSAFYLFSLTRINGFENRDNTKENKYSYSNSIASDTAALRSPFMGDTIFNKQPTSSPGKKQTSFLVQTNILQIHRQDLLLVDSALLPPLEWGMINVTDNKKGYRVRSGNKNAKLIAIPFSQNEIPGGYTLADVHTYFFNTSAKHWIQLKRDSLDIKNEIVYSTNTEDGDYINAIIKSPEAPETTGFAPTTMKDLKAGNPASMIQFFNDPTPNSQGSATLNFHIETPKGRQEIEPNLNVVYNSDAGNGIMGQGWNLNGVSGISVETRWGVPRYLSNVESETYLLDGKMLAMPGDNDELTMSHRTIDINRTSARRRFFCRRENNFSKIERVGSLKDYIWIITDKNGTKYYYGGIIASDNSHIVDAVLREDNKIAEWKLRKVEDLFSNSMEFFYETKETTVNNNTVRSIYLTQILYTYYQNTKHLKNLYKIDLDYDAGSRGDISFSARYGFLSSENTQLLKSINISLVNYAIDESIDDLVNIRKYSFNYSYGSYAKIILDSISQFGYSGDTESLFYSQKFNYYNVDSLNGQYFTDTKISLPTADFLGKSETRAKIGFGGAVGIGAPDFQFTSKSMSFDAQFSYKENESESVVSFIDINGDAKPDIVSKKNGKITYRPNTSHLNNISFGPARSVTGIESFGKDGGSSQGFGTEVNGPTQSRIYSGVDRNTTNSYSKNYFTDANGDGLIDVVENGEVKFNTFDGNADPIAFRSSSAKTPSPITSGSSIGTNLVSEDNSRIAEELKNNITVSPLHDVVKIWIAPDSGKLRIEAPANLIKPNVGNRQEDSTELKKADGVYLSVQQNSAYIFNPIKIPAGDFSTRPISIPSVHVKKGDRILFRVQSGNDPEANGDYDQVHWNPIITYLSKDSSKHFIDPFGNNQFEFNALNDHLYDNEVFNLPDSGSYTISGQLIKPRTKDSITMKITISGSMVKDSVADILTIKRPAAEGGDTTITTTKYTYTVKDSVFIKKLDTSEQTIPTNFLVPQKYSYNTTLSFEIIPASNMDVTEMNWAPKIVFEYYDTTEADRTKRLKKDSVTYFPKIHFRGQLLQTGIFIKARDSGEVKISPIINLNATKEARINLVISDREKVIVRKQINRSTYLTDTISFVRDKNEIFSIHYESESKDYIDMGSGGQKPSFLLIPGDFSNWVVPQTGVYSFYSTKKSALAQSFIRVNNADSLPHNRDTLENISLKENDVISFIDTVSRSAVPFSTILTNAAAVFIPWEMNDYGKLYRGWGQGVINGSNYLRKPIDITAFKLSDVKRANVYETDFFSMPYEIKTLRNTGVNKRIFINKDTLSSSRMAMAHVIPDPIFILTSTIQASGARAVVKYSKSTSTSIAFGGLGATVNTSDDGQTIAYSEYIDLNGDKYPDIAGVSSVQFTTALGGLERQSIPLMTGLQHTTATSRGINLGGVFFHAFTGSGKSNTQKVNTVSTAASKIAAALSGLSGGYNENTDEVRSNLYDVNGDGLPDRINRNGHVFINKGNGFSIQAMQWGLKSIQTNASKTVSLGGGLNTDNNSISAGINLAETTTEQNSSLVDINGDGFIDNVIKDNKTVVVYLNTGNGINPAANQKINLGNSPDISKSIASSRGISGAYTYAPHIFVLAVPVCKIVFSVSSNVGDGDNTVRSQWIDINGDGFVDHVSYQGNDVNLKLSNLGKINRLKKVENPIGGSVEFDYKHIQGDFKHPGGKWVMSSIVKNDGIADDGDNTRTDFNYAEGYYDRYEREFLGFKNVTATDYLDNKRYRVTVSEYNNQNYYVAHQLSKSWIENADGNKYRYEEYDYHEKYRNHAAKINTLAPPPASLFKMSVMQYMLKAKRTYAYEGQNDKILLSQVIYKYDSLLNPVTYEFSEGNTPQQQNKSYYRTEIAYKKMDSKLHIYGLPISMMVKNKNNVILKKITANYPLGKFRHKMQSDTVFFSDRKFATTLYRYDDNCGNLIKKTYANGKIDTFEFDKNFETYLTKIIDPYKLENNFEYDFRFGSETKKTLTNGSAIKTKYDDFGRVVKIQGPHQNSIDIESSDYTIKIEYITQPAKSYSIVKHYDEKHINDGIYTINFIDGFARSIQTKKTGIVNGVPAWLVSGRQFFDGLYRLTKSYYPTTQAYDVAGDMIIGNTGRILKSDTDRIAAALTGYDILDRMVTTKLPNGKTFENNVYSIKKDGFNNDAQVTITTYGSEAKLNKKELFTNGSGLVSTEVFYPIAGNDSLNKITKYEYDPIHQLINIYNVHEGKQYHVIGNKFDWNGRKLQYFNINSGVTHYEYDKVDNLEKKINAKNDTINYAYEHKRLIRVSYPKHPEDSVRYVYGEKSNPKSFYNAGKIVFQVDATGAQSFEYDVYGNVTANTRTIIAPFDTTYTFSSRFKYDSWGRLLQMTYPSGEVVNYIYNPAGHPIKVYGSAHGTVAEKFKYINNIMYDKFEQRQQVEYGNDLITNYRYEDTLRRLGGMQTVKAGKEIMLSTYQYDELNNIRNNTDSSNFPGMNAVKMKHEYGYDNQNHLLSASGKWNVNTKYDLMLTYDDQFNIKTKQLDLYSNEIKRNINSQFYYKTNNPLQLEHMKDRIERKNATTNKNYSETNTSYYSYDGDGNNIITNIADSFHNNVNERKILWDEENRIRAISSNGYVSSYTYDADGARTIKISNEISGVYINGQFAGSHTSPATYSLYVSPYFSVRNAKGIGTKHIYLGEERLVSQLTNYSNWVNMNGEASTYPPEKDTLKMTEALAPKNKFIRVGYIKKMHKTEALINSYFDSLQVPHKTIEHNAFKRTWPALNYPVVANPANQFQTGSVINQVDSDEKLRYFYHRNHIGSSSFISDKEGDIVQYVEYLPFGETFMEARKNYSSQFLFNGKEQDQETGLYYYGARYYDTQTYQWLGVDPMAEKYPGLSPYNYCLNNPVAYIDDAGKTPRLYVETIRLGHAFVTTGSQSNPVVYTYGRYLGGDFPGSGDLSVTGTGVLIKVEGADAKKYINNAVQNLNAKAYEITDAKDAAVDKYFAGLWNKGTPLNEHQSKTYKDRKNPGTPANARVLDSYRLFSNNCVTKSIESLKAGGTTQSFTNDYKNLIDATGKSILNDQIFSPFDLKFYMDWQSEEY